MRPGDSDAGADPASETAEGHYCLSPARQSSRQPRIPEWLTAVFTVVLAGATVALVWTSIKQHRDAVEAIEETKHLAAATDAAVKETASLAIATENAVTDRRRTASADFMMKIGDKLDEPRYDRISNDIQEHNSTYRLPKYLNKSDADVYEYIVIFEDLGYFVAEELIGAKIVYERLSYDVEKAWCNITVQETIRNDRAADKSKTAQTDPEYGNFEKLAERVPQYRRAVLQ